MSKRGLTQDGISSPSSAAATEPPLMPFTLNFTITNLPYEEGMWPPGSWTFNSTDKILQDLVRVPAHLPPALCSPGQPAPQMPVYTLSVTLLT